MILSRVPYPLDKGDKLRAYHQLIALSKKYDIHLTCLTESEIDKNQRKELECYTKSLTIHKLNRWVQYWRLFLALFSHKPFQIHYFYQKKIAKKISRQIEALQPNFIYCQLIRVAEYVKDIHHISKTLDYMDALSVGMARQASINKGLRKYAMNVEGDRLKQYENRIFDYFNHHTIISEQDKQLVSHTANYSIHVVPNGIDESFLNCELNCETEYDLVFVGNLNYAPNIDSCLYIIDELLPALKLNHPEIQVLLAGTSPSQKILDRAENYKNITISGWVDDIRTCYLSSKICIAPLFIGTGLQNKLLESMALGIPCVTTDLANNALKAKSDSEILLANSLEEFKLKIDLLLSDTKLYNDISKSGKLFVKSKFNWQNSTNSIPF
ncbi:MAG: glycosyltransferase [Crocinitomicaceae bacterium]